MRRSLVVGVLAAALTLAACGADDGTPTGTASASPSATATLEPTAGLSSPAQPSDPEEAAAARQVVARYFAALFAEEPAKACAELTPAYQQASIAEGISVGVSSTDDCATAITTVAIKAIKEYELAKGAFRIGVGVTDGDSATVPVDAPIGFEDVTYVLTRIGTRWFIDGEA